MYVPVKPVDWLERNFALIMALLLAVFKPLFSLLGGLNYLPTSIFSDIVWSAVAFDVWAVGRFTATSDPRVLDIDVTPSLRLVPVILIVAHLISYATSLLIIGFTSPEILFLLAGLVYLPCYLLANWGAT